MLTPRLTLAARWASLTLVILYTVLTAVRLQHFQVYPQLVLGTHYTQ
jgi:hypothetical protein